MLQEVLLCLAGYDSIVHQQTWEDAKKDEATVSTTLLAAPPERALLSTAARLGNLHARIKKHVAEIAATHPSIVCRAVASAIRATHLRGLLDQLASTEKTAMSKDPRCIAENVALPLSAIIAEFAPWLRRLEWLWEAACFMQPVFSTLENPQRSHSATGASLINFLRQASQTGYGDLESMIIELIKVAETAWLQQLSSWVLYGQQPAFGSEDFFVRPIYDSESNRDPVTSRFLIREALIPEFVSTEAASSILSIVQSLNQINAYKHTSTITSLDTGSIMKLLPTHLAKLQAIVSPISAGAFSGVISSIRTSLSQNVLSQLLPLTDIVEILRVLQDFMLLQRSEFAVSLIRNADERLNKQHDLLGHSGPARNFTHSENILLKDASPDTVMRQAFAELAALQSEDLGDEILERGRSLLRTTVDDLQVQKARRVPDFSILVFGLPSSITLHLPSNSQLSLFLSDVELVLYAEMNSYLLSLRRATLRLEGLWKLTGFRRGELHIENSPDSSNAAQSKDFRQRRRSSAQVKQAWATASEARFVLVELGSHFQSRIVQGYSEHFVSWLANSMDGGQVNHTSNDSLKINYQPAKSRRTDAAQLVKAHKQYLAALRSSLMLNRKSFTRKLFSFLRTLDHFVALFREVATEAMRNCTGPQFSCEMSSGWTNNAVKESKLLEKLEESRHMVEQQLIELVDELRMPDEDDNESDLCERNGELMEEVNPDTSSSYVPLRTPHLDGLLLMLDFVGTKSKAANADNENKRNK